MNKNYQQLVTLIQDMLTDLGISLEDILDRVNPNLVQDENDPVAQLSVDTCRRLSYANIYPPISYSVPEILANEFWDLVAPYRDVYDGFGNDIPLDAMVKKLISTPDISDILPIEKDMDNYFTLVEQLKLDFKTYNEMIGSDLTKIPLISTYVQSFNMIKDKDKLILMVEDTERRYLARNIAMGGAGIWMTKASPTEQFNSSTLEQFKMFFMHVGEVTYE